LNHLFKFNKLSLVWSVIYSSLSGKSFKILRLFVLNMESKKLQNQKKILSFLLKNPSFSGSWIAKSLKLPKTIVCSVIKRYNQTLTMDRSPGSWRPASPVDKNLSKKVLRSFKVFKIYVLALVGSPIEPSSNQTETTSKIFDPNNALDWSLRVCWQNFEVAF
jgi:hypothetical protein